MAPRQNEGVRAASGAYRLMFGLLGTMADLTARGHHTLNGRLFDCGSYLRLYRELITRELSGSGYILHLGSGDGISLGRTKEISSPDSRFVCVDIDSQSIEKNPARLRVMADAAALPFKDGFFQALCSEHLLEHLASPLGVFRESRRVLRDGGHFIFAAPHGWSYIALAARVVPLKLREGFVSFASGIHGGRRHFPTYYRANSPFAIRRLAHKSGFVVERVEGFVGEPRYTLALPVVHLIAIAWHKILEVFGLQRVVGLTLVGSLVKRK